MDILRIQNGKHSFRQQDIAFRQQLFVKDQVFCCVIRLINFEIRCGNTPAQIFRALNHILDIYVFFMRFRATFITAARLVMLECGLHGITVNFISSRLQFGKVSLPQKLQSALNCRRIRVKLVSKFVNISDNHEYRPFTLIILQIVKKNTLAISFACMLLFYTNIHIYAMIEEVQI